MKSLIYKSKSKIESPWQKKENNMVRQIKEWAEKLIQLNHKDIKFLKSFLYRLAVIAFRISLSIRLWRLIGDKVTEPQRGGSLSWCCLYPR